MSETGGTIDPEEIGRFTARADEWWDPEGSFRPLHRLNPTRLGYIRQHLARISAAAVAHCGLSKVSPCSISDAAGG